MKTKIYYDNDQFIAGTTLKDDIELEHNNMALHTCVNEADVLKIENN